MYWSLKRLREKSDEYKKLYERSKEVSPKFKEGDYVVADIYHLRIYDSHNRLISRKQDNGGVDYMDSGDVCGVIYEVGVEEIDKHFEVVYTVLVDLDCDQAYTGLNGKKGVWFHNVYEKALRKTDKLIKNTFKRTKQVVKEKVIYTFDDGTTSEETKEINQNERGYYYYYR